MKIIFLDIDGPLSNDRTQAQTGDWWSFDPVACQALDNICEAADTKVVIISSRHYSNRPSYHGVCTLFKEAGFDPCHLHQDWCVNNKDLYDENGKQRPRGEMIERWLARHSEVTHYAVVDDEFVESPNLVQVSMTDGILTSHFNQIAAYLDIDLGKIFETARLMRGRDYETQYLLPFGTFENQCNKQIDKDFSP